MATDTRTYTITRNAQTITIVSPEGTKRCIITLARLDSIEMTGPEQTVLAPIEDTGTPGVPFAYNLTLDEAALLASIRNKCDSVTPPAPAPVAAPAPVVVAPVVPAPAPVVTPPAPAPVAAPECNDDDGDNKPKRKKRTDATSLYIYEQIRTRTRAVGVDEMERRINRLTAIRDRVIKDVFLINYDIPTVTRQQIVEPTGLLWLFGFPLSESVWIVPAEDVESEALQRLFSLWDTYDSGPGKITYWVDPFSAKGMDQIKIRASAALADMLRKAHTDLIVGLDDADKAMAAAMKEADTDRKMLEADRGRANTYRAKMRAAAESLNVALRAAEKYDSTEEVRDLLAGLRAALAARRDAFNAAQTAKDAKGVEI